MKQLSRFFKTRLGTAFSWLCMLMGPAAAQTPLQDLPSTVISSGGTFNFSGSASFTDLNTGYDGDLVTAGNQPFDTGYLVKSLSGLGTLTTLNLGQAAGAPSVINLAANPYYLGLNWNYSPNTSLLAIYNSKAVVSLQNIQINQFASPSVTPSSTAFYGQQVGYSKEFSGGVEAFNYGYDASVLNLGHFGAGAAEYSIDLKNIQFHAYPAPLKPDSASFLHCRSYPDDPEVWSPSVGTHASSMTVQLNVNGGQYDVGTMAQLLGSQSNVVSFKGGVLVRQTGDSDETTLFKPNLIQMFDGTLHNTFTLNEGASLQADHHQVLTIQTTNSVSEGSRTCHSEINLMSGSIMRGTLDRTDGEAAVEVRDQRKVDFAVTGAQVRNYLGDAAVKFGKIGRRGEAGSALSFFMSGGEISNGLSPMAETNNGFYALALSDCVNHVSFTMTGGEIKTAYTQGSRDVIRVTGNNDPDGSLALNLIGGSITANWDDPAVPGAPWSAGDSALRIRLNQSPTNLMIGDAVTQSGPTISGRRYGIFVQSNTGSVNLIMQGGLIQTEHTPIKASFAPYVTSGIEVDASNVSAILQLFGGQINAGTNGFAADGIVAGNGTRITLGTGNAGDPDSRMKILATRNGVSLANTTTGSSSLLLRDGATLSAQTLIVGQANQPSADSISISGGSLTSTGAGTARSIQTGGGADVVSLLRVRSTNLSYVTLGSGNDRLVLDAAFLTVSGNFSYLEGGDFTNTGTAAASGVDTLRLQGALTLAESITDNTGMYRSFNNLELAGGATMSVNQLLEAEGGLGANADNSVVLERTTVGGVAGVLTGGGAQFIDAGGGRDTLNVSNINDINASMFGSSARFRNFEVLNLGAGAVWNGSLNVGSVGIAAVNLVGGQIVGTLTLTSGDDFFTYIGTSNTDVEGNGGVDTLVVGSSTAVSAANVKSGVASLLAEAEFLNFTHLILEDGASLTGSYNAGAEDNLFAKYGSSSHGSVDLSAGLNTVRLGSSGLHSAALDLAAMAGVDLVELSTTQDARNTGDGDDTWQLHAADDSFSSIDARGNRVTSNAIQGDVLSVPSGQALNGADFGAAARYRGFDSLNLAGSLAGTVTLDAGINTITLNVGVSFAGGSIIDAGAGTDYVSMLGGGAWNSSRFANAEVFTLDIAATDTWMASATDASITSVDAGTATSGADLDQLDLSYATGTVRDNSTNAIVGSSGKYRNFERVLLGGGHDTWQVGATSGVVNQTTSVEPGYIDAGVGSDILDLVGGGTYQASGLIGPSSTYRNFEILRINNGASPLTYSAHSSFDPAVIHCIGAADAILVVEYSRVPTLSQDIGKLSGRYRGFDGLTVAGDVRITAIQTLAETGDAGFSLIRATPAALTASLIGGARVSAGSSSANNVTLGNVTGVTLADFDNASGKLRGFESAVFTAGSSLVGESVGMIPMALTFSNTGLLAPGEGNAGSLGAGSVSLAAGGVYACDVSGSTNDVVNTGTLTLGGTSKLVLQALDPESLIHVIATYTTLNGTFATVENLPAGYRLIHGGYMGNKIALVSDVYADFAAWALNLGISLGGNTLDFDADTDGDGRSNLDEYLLDGDPLADDVAPAIAAPVGGFTPLVFVVAPGGTAALPNFLPHALISDPHGVASSSQSPVAGTLLNAGSHAITLSATDTPGNIGSLTLNVHVVTTPATVSMASAVYTVDQGASSAVVTLTRSGHLEAASVTIKTADGTTSTVPPFSAAVAGTDYTAVNSVVAFAAGETSKTVTVALLPKAGKQPNKRFMVSLSSPGPGSQLGALSSAMVRILSQDTTKPVLTVLTPKAGTTALSAVSPYLVTGTVGDANGIDRVEVVFNGAPPLTATLGSSTKNTSIPWSLEIVPVEGSSNTLVVTAYDLKGNVSLAVTRTFTFTRRYKLTVTRTAPVAVSLAGALSVVTTPRTAATGFLPVIATANPKVSQILPGVPVKLSALPLKGYVFSHWASKPAGATELGNVLSFTMPAQDVTAEAVFVANLFAATAGQGNTFYGLLSPFGAATTGNSTVGWFTGTIASASGSFSGRVMIDGVNKAFVGTFYGDSGMFFTNGTTKSRTLTVGSRSMTLSIDSAGIHVALSEGATQVVAGLAKRAQYSSANKVPVAMLNRKTRAGLTANDQGFFTVALPSKVQVPAKDMTTYPHGDGFGSVTLSNFGVVTLVGTLADGSTFLGSSGLVSSGGFPAYAQLVTPGAAVSVKGGSLSGLLTVDVAQANSDVTGTDLLWIRPTVTQLTGTSAAAKATQLYTEGWPTGIRVDAVGAFYDKTKDVRTGLGLGAANLTTGNGELLFTGGRLTADVTVRAFNIETGTAAGTSKVTKIPVGNSTFTLVVAQGVGQFNGMFTPNWTNAVVSKPVFRGVMLQKGGSKGGYGYFISNRSGDADPQAGRVTLGAQTP